MDAIAAWEGWSDSLAGEACESTHRQYTDAVWRFLGRARLARSPIDAISRNHVTAYFGRYVPTGAAKAHTHAALLSFFRWCDFEGLLFEHVNPMNGITVKYEPPPDPLSLTQDELGRLVTEVERWRGRRTALCVLLGYVLALRRMELAGLRWADVVTSTEGPVVRLTTTKGGRVRDIPLPDEAIAVLAEIRTLPMRFARKGRREGGYIVGVSPGQISGWVDQAAKRAGIPEPKTHSHILRATGATDMMRDGTPPEVVRRILGHAKLVTTQRYFAVLDSDKREAMDRAGARASLALAAISAGGA